MFHYNFAGFVGPSNQNDPAVTGATLKSPYDNPIVNANYVNWNLALKANKWTFRTGFVYAKALQTAEADKRIFNTWERKFYDSPSGVQTQSKSLGWEMDYGATFNWDDSFRFDLDMGWYLPGDYYKYTNTPNQAPVASLFAVVFKAGVVF